MAWQAALPEAMRATWFVQKDFKFGLKKPVLLSCPCAGNGLCYAGGKIHQLLPPCQTHAHTRPLSPHHVGFHHFGSLLCSTAASFVSPKASLSFAYRWVCVTPRAGREQYRAKAETLQSPDTHHVCHRCIPSELWGCRVLGLCVLTLLTISNYLFCGCAFCRHYAKLLCCSSSPAREHPLLACEMAAMTEGWVITTETGQGPGGAVGQMARHGRARQSPPGRRPARLHAGVLGCRLSQVFYKQRTPSRLQ